MLLKISRFFLYASLFSVIVVLPNTFFPFIGGKDVFFRVAVELSLIAVILWWGFEAPAGEMKKKFSELSKSPIVTAVSCFALAFLLASLFAYDPHAAFWSNFERGEGGFQMLHYYAFFLLFMFLMRDERDWRRAFGVSLAAAVLMILYGIAANLGLTWPTLFISPYAGGGIVPPTFWGRLTTARFQGSLGNPAYVAPYLMFALFYGLYLWRVGRLKAGGNLWRDIGYAALGLSFLFFFVLTQTRGTFFGLGAAVIIFLIYLAVRGSAKTRAAAIWILAAVILANAALFALRDTPFVEHIPGGRFYQSSLQAHTLDTRFWTWGSAWKGFLERPVFGWGPENFTAVFDKYFDPRHFIPGQNTETWFDRAHSVIFDYLAETGIVGLVAYLAMLASFYYEFFRRPPAQGGGRDAVVEGALLALVAGYFVQGLVLFDVLPIYINLFLALAFAARRFAAHRAAHQPAPVRDHHANGQHA